MKIRLPLPSYVAIGLSVVAGILAYLNQQTFSVPQPWHELITAGLAALAVLGIAPAAHGSLSNSLHIPYQLALAISSAAATAAVGAATLHVDGTLRALFVGALTAVAGMLAGPGPGGVQQQFSQPVAAPEAPSAPPVAPIVANPSPPRRKK